VLVQNVPPEHAQELYTAVSDSNHLLVELESALSRYTEAGLQGKRAWDNGYEHKEEEDIIRAKIDSQVAVFTELYEKLDRSDQPLVEEALSRLLKDLQGGRRDATSIISLCTAAETGDENLAWAQLSQELTTLGILNNTAAKYQLFIFDWCLNVMEEGLLYQDKDAENMGNVATAASGLSLTDSMASDDHRMVAERTISHTSVSRKPVASSQAQIPVSSEFISTAPLATPPHPPPPLPATAHSPNPSGLYAFSQGHLPPPEPPIPVSNTPPIPQTFYQSSPGSQQLGVYDGSTLQSFQSSTQSIPLAAQGESFRAPLQMPHQQLPYQQLPYIAPAPSTVRPDSVGYAGISDESNIIWTAQRIAEHWNKKEWAEAEKYLEMQLGAVMAGQTIIIRDTPTCPDVRILYHLLGCCASFQGHYDRAKQHFEAVQRGPFTGGVNLDDGEVAAAVWLGDTCLLLNEPANAALAWSMAIDGLTAKHGFEKVSKSRFLVDLRALEGNLRGLSELRDNFNRLNVDASTIFNTTPTANKSSLVAVTFSRLLHSSPTSTAPNRVFLKTEIAEGFLMQPLITKASWPLQYDPFFRADQTVLLQREMRRTASFLPANLPSTGLGGAKKLDFVTKQSAEWLWQTLKEALQFHKIKFTEASNGFMAFIERKHGSISSHRALPIVIRKLSLRASFGFEVMNTMYVTRAHAGAGGLASALTASTESKGEVVRQLRSYCEQCEQALLGKGVRPDHPTVPEVADTPLAEMAGATTRTNGLHKTHGELDGGAAPVELPGSVPLATT